MVAAVGLAASITMTARADPPVNPSDVAAGIGGFVIYGIDPDDTPQPPSMYFDDTSFFFANEWA